MSPTCSGHLALAGKVFRCSHPEKVEYENEKLVKIIIFQTRRSLLGSECMTALNCMPT